MGLYKDQAIKLLADGFKSELVEFIETDDKFMEVIMDLIDEFINDNIPVRGEQNRTDLAFLMLDSLRLTNS